MKQILVVTATLGNRETLQRTVDSVRNIGGDYVKHVIVCPEREIETLRLKFGDDIEYLPELKDKRGIYAALNHGLRTFGHDYPYMTFINDDDYWLPSFKYLIEVIQKGYDFVYGKVDYIMEDQDGEIRPMACTGQFKDFIPLLIRNIVLFTQQATLIKSDLFFKLGGFSEKYKLVSDTKFWADLSLMDINFRYISKSCAAYTIQDGQLSSDGNTQEKEMNDLISSYSHISMFRVLGAMLKYRIYNIPVYIKRLFL